MNSAITVSQINEYIKNIFDNEELLHNINIYGEISGVSISGGNMYFTIKDEGGILPCVLFGTVFKDIIINGEQVLLTGTPRYYAKGGRLSFNVTKAVPYGKGLLYQQYLELKAKLEKEGLFDEAHKKEIPKFVRKIGVVSSENGAVIQDIINVTTRRNDSVNIVIFPVKVQGVGAEQEISRGIDFFSNYDVDVVIVARGGGSFEDLMPFNTEIVARSTYTCLKPIISAVGHETDFTIIDFVSDLRAPTPSAAAELAVLSKEKEIKNLKQMLIRCDQALLNKIDTSLISTKNNLIRVANTYDFNIDKNGLNLVNKVNLITSTFNTLLIEKTNSIDRLLTNLNAVNPMSILKRGYAKLSNNFGQSIISIKDLKQDSELIVEIVDGKAQTKVIKTEDR